MVEFERRFRALPTGCKLDFPPRRPMGASLDQCWVLVAYSSSSTIDALIAGVPAMRSSSANMAWPVTDHSLAAVERPTLFEREQWLYDLAYAQWSADEMRSGMVWQHLRPRWRAGFPAPLAAPPTCPRPAPVSRASTAPGRAALSRRRIVARVQATRNRRGEDRRTHRRLASRHIRASLGRKTLCAACLRRCRASIDTVSGRGCTERERPRALALLKRINNILRFGFGAEALEEKRAQKSAARRAIFDSSDAWERQAGFATRRYESYEAYLRHQATKLDLVSERLEETEGGGSPGLQAPVRGLRAAPGRAHGALPRRPARHRGRGVPVPGLLLGRHRPESRPREPLRAHRRLPRPGLPRRLGRRHLHQRHGSRVRHGPHHGRGAPRAAAGRRPVRRRHARRLCRGLHARPRTSPCIGRAARRCRREIAALGGLEVVESRDLGQHRRDRWTQVVFRKNA